MSRRGIITIAVIVLVATAAILTYTNRHSLNPKAPLAEMETARKALTQSKKNKSDIYAPSIFKQAEKLYDSAMICWKGENEKLPFNRDYSLVKKLAAESEHLALRAVENSKKSLSGIKFYVRHKTDSIQNAWKNFRQVFTQIPLPQNIRKKYTHGMMLLSESEKACQSSKYHLAMEKLTMAEKDLSVASGYSRKMLSDYFAAYTEWKEWADKTITASKKTGAYAIIIDKFSRECFLYHKGKLKDRFNIELGANWIGDKKHKGDKSTPEGFYKIVTKKEGRKTKYHKALLIDYPNKEDKERFRINKKNGVIGKTADPGGNIEIHGGGGKGADWTEGCIALKNSDMDILFRHTSVGTPVTIVGSLKPLETYVR
ncbi:MAG: L,D-transpeptidase [Bacteroidales bacterium]|nr:L,D-transpeptidase [Bacteroidales bacterium]